MFLTEDGKIIDGKGFEEQIKLKPSDKFPESKFIIEDFDNLMADLHKNAAEIKTTLYAITGFQGWVINWLNISFQRFGNKKLPRKKKKYYFLTHKLRKRFLPQYYKNR